MKKLTLLAVIVCCTHFTQAQLLKRIANRAQQKLSKSLIKR
ncbi:hypothetical protein [Paraflavitalea speifideaquila]|nr:hypothetical protein [Paraflavitalea speifideiaquila]